MPIIEDIVDEITKNKVRTEIYLLLILNDKPLNASQISKELKRSKTTIARHLRALSEEDLLDADEIETNGQYNPIFYSIPEILKNEIRSLFVIDDNLANIPTEQDNRLKFYQSFLENSKLLVKIIAEAFSLINPFIDSKKNHLNGIDEADSELHKYFYPVKSFDLQTFVISEGLLPEFRKEYIKFKNKILELARIEEETQGVKEKSYLFFDSLLPLRDILTTNKTSKK